MFEIRSRDEHSRARSGTLTTAHGVVLTPAFVAVATRASVKAAEPAAITCSGVQMVICNAYHLHLRPGGEVVAALGGLHGFSGWSGPTMTDSGGFQVFSLGAGKDQGVGKIASIFPDSDATRNAVQPTPGRSLVKLTKDGVRFRSIVDGSEHVFTPESVILLQRRLGADIMLPLDECTSPLHDFSYTQGAMARTHHWARRALRAFERADVAECDVPNPGQILYGIVQGGAYEPLRRESAATIGEMPFGGFAIGGSLGRSKAEMHAVLAWTIPALPERAPRHLLGIGEIEDLFTAVRLGVDTFDCASPTRLARNGSVLVQGAPRHRINLRNARFRTDPRPIDPDCDCPACRNHSRAYLHHLVRGGELAFYRMTTLHNLHFLARLMGTMRGAIEAGCFDELEMNWSRPPAEGI